MRDQAADLRELARSRGVAVRRGGGATRLVVVAGSQVGVGASTVCVNLSLALARQGRRTVLVDADLTRGDASTACRLSGRDSILDVLTGTKSLVEALESAPGGLLALAGAWAPAESSALTSADHERLIGQLQSLDSHADILLVDAGSSREGLARRLWQAADLVLLVTTASADAVMDAYAAIKLLAPSDESPAVGLVVNRACDLDQADDVQRRVAEAGRKFLARSVLAAGQIGEEDDAGASEPLRFDLRRLAAWRDVELIAEWTWQRQQAALRSSHAWTNRRTA